MQGLGNQTWKRAGNAQNARRPDACSFCVNGSGAISSNVAGEKGEDGFLWPRHECQPEQRAEGHGARRRNLQ